MATENVSESSLIGCRGHGSESSAVVAFKLFGVEIRTPAVNVGESRQVKVQGNERFTGSSNDSSNLMKRLKVKPWSVEEHYLFLEGLKKRGKGKWKAISEEFVRTRTCAQVASHAQKFFIRMAKSDESKKRYGIFDVPADKMIEMVSLLNSGGTS